MAAQPHAADRRHRGATRVRTALLLAWAAASFGVTFFARELDQVVAGWPINFWWAAQGGVLVFIGIGMVYAWFMNRTGLDEPEASAQPHPSAGRDEA